MKGLGGGGDARASSRPEFEGFGKGELSGGMDSCLRRNDGWRWVSGALEVSQSAGCTGLGDFFKEEVEATGGCVGFDLAVPEVFLQVIEPSGHFSEVGGGQVLDGFFDFGQVGHGCAHLLVYCTPIGSEIRLGMLPLRGLMREWACHGEGRHKTCPYGGEGTRPR